MLQQTQVSRVLPHYERFLAAFPSAVECARARPAEVIRLWSGLGYNRRALNLHRAATVVVAEHGGIVPSSDTSLRALPGVGDYTARAVRSFAFGEDVATVDTNAVRVLAAVSPVRRCLSAPQRTSVTAWSRPVARGSSTRRCSTSARWCAPPNRRACSAPCAGSAPGTGVEATDPSTAPIRGAPHRPHGPRAPSPARTDRGGDACSMPCDTGRCMRRGWRVPVVGPTTLPAPNEWRQRWSTRASPAGRAERSVSCACSERCACPGPARSLVVPVRFLCVGPCSWSLLVALADGVCRRKVRLRRGTRGCAR